MKKQWKWLWSSILAAGLVSAVGVSLTSCSTNQTSTQQKTISNPEDITSYETPENSAINAKGEPSFPWAKTAIDTAQLNTISGQEATTVTPNDSNPFPLDDSTTNSIIESFVSSVQKSGILSLIQLSLQDVYFNLSYSAANVENGYKVVAWPNSLNVYSTLYVMDQILGAGANSYTYQNGGSTYNVDYGTDFTYKNFFLNDWSWKNGKWSFELYFDNATFQNIDLGQVSGNIADGDGTSGGWNVKTLSSEGTRSQNLQNYIFAIYNEYIQTKASLFANFNINTFVNWLDTKIADYAKNNSAFNASEYENLIIIPYVIGVQADSGGSIWLDERVYVLPMYQNIIYDSIAW